MAGLAAELDGKYARVYGCLHDDLTQKQPSVPLVRELARTPGIEEVSLTTNGLLLDALAAPKFEIPRLHHVIVRTHPVVPEPTPERPTKPEAAVFRLNALSATGSGILLAAIVAGLAMGHAPREMVRIYGRTLWRVRYSLLTIGLCQHAH